MTYSPSAEGSIPGIAWRTENTYSLSLPPFHLPPWMRRNEWECNSCTFSSSRTAFLSPRASACGLVSRRQKSRSQFGKGARILQYWLFHWYFQMSEHQSVTLRVRGKQAQQKLKLGGEKNSKKWNGRLRKVIDICVLLQGRDGCDVARKIIRNLESNLLFYCSFGVGRRENRKGWWLRRGENKVKSKDIICPAQASKLQPGINKREMTCMDLWLTGDMLMHILENHLKLSNCSWLCVKTLSDGSSLLSKTWLEFLPVATGWASGLRSRCH